jgi:hypothetical protein
LYIFTFFIKFNKKIDNNTKSYKIAQKYTKKDAARIN